MKTKIEVELNLTPDQLAEAFICWGSDKQSHFINLIGKHFKECDFDAEYQCCCLAGDINKDGRDFLYTVANFVKVAKLPSNSPKIDQLIDHYPCDSL